MPRNAENKQRLDLDVVSLPLESCRLPSNFSKSGYILDVCLDYFSTNNPFYEEILGIVPKTGLIAVENLYKFLSKIINKKCIHSNKQRNIDGQHNKSTSIDNTAKYIADGHIDFITYLFDTSTISQKDPCTTDPAFEMLFHEISDQLCYDNEDLENQNSAGCEQEKRTSSSLKSNFVEAVRQFLNILRTLPQDKYATLKECFTVGLPKHKSSKSEMRQLLQNFEKYLAFFRPNMAIPSWSQ